MKANVPSVVRPFAMIWLLFAVNVEAEQPTLTVISEGSPLTQLQQADRGGEATVFVQALLEETGISHAFSFLPWRRGYRVAQEQANTLIYPIARSSLRESKFLWVGRLIPVNYYLVKLRQRRDIQVKTLLDARDYRIGVVNAHVHHQYLVANGMRNLQDVNSNQQNLKKALLGRIDLFPISDGGLLPICKKEKIDCSQFEPVLQLADLSGGLYLAASLQTSPEIVEALKRAYQQLQDSGISTQTFASRLEDIEAFYRMWPNAKHLSE